MTANELREQLRLCNYPSKYEVDHETYANCCQDIFDWKMRNEEQEDTTDISVRISIGPNNGILFKNVELILIRK